jgi:hypothetical protein
MVAYLMLVALLFILINFPVDIAYAGLDPRLRVKVLMHAASPFARFWSEFCESPPVVAALVVVVIISGMAVAAPLIAPQDP